MILEGLSSVCAKLEPASSDNDEILEIKCPSKIYIFISVELSVKHNTQCPTNIPDND